MNLTVLVSHDPPECPQSPSKHSVAYWMMWNGESDTALPLTKQKKVVLHSATVIHDMKELSHSKSCAFPHPCSHTKMACAASYEE